MIIGDLMGDLTVTEPFIIITLIVFSIPHYLFLIRKHRYIDIKEEFEKKEERVRKKGGIMTWFYTVGSIIFLFAVFFLQATLNQHEYVTSG